MACWPATPWPSRQAGIASYPTSSGRGRHGRQAPVGCANAGCPASRFAPAWACRRLRSVLARDRGKPRELPPTGEPPGSGYAGAEASGDPRPSRGVAQSCLNPGKSNVSGLPRLRVWAVGNCVLPKRGLSPRLLGMKIQFKTSEPRLAVGKECSASCRCSKPKMQSSA